MFLNELKLLTSKVYTKIWALWLDWTIYHTARVSVSLSAEEGSFGRRVEAALSSCGGIASTSIETGLEKGFFF